MSNSELKNIETAPKIAFSSTLRWDNGAHKNERAHWLGRMTEWLFDFGGEGHTVRSGLDVDKAVPAKFEFASKKPHWAVIAAKVLLLATGIIPLLFVIGKAIYRAMNNVVELNTASNKMTKFFQDRMVFNLNENKFKKIIKHPDAEALINFTQKLVGKISDAEQQYQLASTEEQKKEIAEYYEKLTDQLAQLKAAAQKPEMVSSIHQYLEKVMGKSSSEVDVKVILETIELFELGSKEVEAIREEANHRIQMAAPFGIGNIGNSCYINSFLQAMMTVPKIVEYLNDSTDQDVMLAPLRDFKAAYDRRDMEGCLKAVRTFRKLAYNHREPGSLNAMYQGQEGVQNDPGQMLQFLFDKAGQGVRIHDFDRADDSLYRIGAREASIVVHAKNPEYKGEYHFQELLNTRFEGNRIATEDMQGARIPLPETILVQFARFNADDGAIRKIDNRVVFPRSGVVDFKDCLLGHDEEVLYQLVAVVSHIGATPRCGHYTAEVKRNGQWYNCDDSAITPQDNPHTSNGYYFVLQRVTFD